MAITGNLAEFTFASTTYDADDCLQSWDISDAINEVVYQCDGFDHTAAGTRKVSFSGSIALTATDLTRINALTPGTVGTFEAHPGGDTATYIEIHTLVATVVSRNITAPMNGIVSMDFVINLDDVTYQAAT